MFDRDIRNFFKSDGNKSSTNQSNMIKQLTLDPKKDIKKITKKSTVKKEEKKEKPKKEKKEKKEKKSKIKLTEEEKEEEKKEFLTPVKKKVEIKKNNNIQINKPKIKQSKNNKIIIDEEDESEKVEIINEEKKAGKIEKEEKIIKKEKNNKKEEYKIPTPIKKEEKLIPISASDFFSSKKITLKTDKQIKEEQKEKEIKESIIEENKMEIEEEDIKDIKLENNKSNNFEKKENNKEKENNKINEKKEEKNNNDNFEIDEDFIEEMILEEENKNKKKDEKKENKILDLNKEEKDKSKNIIKNKPIIRREIKKEINNISNKINKPITTNEFFNKNKLPISELLVDKYNPKVITDIIGNQQQLRNLEIWLDNWDNCILHGHKNEINKTSKKNSKNENVNARAAIISGPPGIGKTSSVRVLTKNKGYRTFELNSSDKRNKDTINNSVGFLMNNTTLSSIDNSTNTKNIIIMDEVDGMAGNEDKGGIKALIDIVKKTKVPIIFICNDIYSPKLKTLINHCYNIKFFKPDKRQIVLRLMDICKKEGIIADNQMLSYLVESFGNDIRQTINYLDLYSRGNKNNNNLKNNCDEAKKDKSVTVGSFDITKILLNKIESSKLNFEQKLDLFFVDFDLIPGMMHENYINTAKINNNSLDKTESLQKIIQGLDHISFSDTIENKMKSQMEWSLLPDKGIHSTVIPSIIFSSFLNFPKFPELFGGISKINKNNRELLELKKIFSNYSLFEIQNEVGPLFFNIITDKLVNEGKNGIDGIVDIFAYYRMNANLFKENLYNLQSKEFQTIYSKVNTSLKTSLTKKLNERFKTSLKQHKTRTIMMPEIKIDKEGNIIEDFDLDDVDEEDADDQSSSFFEPIKKTNKKKK